MCSYLRRNLFYISKLCYVPEPPPLFFSRLFLFSIFFFQYSFPLSPSTPYSFSSATLQFHTLAFSLSLLFSSRLHYLQPSGSVGKESACNAETSVWSLGQEEPLDKGTATHSSILAWIFHWQMSRAGYSPWDHKELGHDCVTFTKSSISFQRSLFNFTHMLWISTSTSWQYKVELKSCLVSNVCYLT